MDRRTPLEAALPLGLDQEISHAADIPRKRLRKAEPAAVVVFVSTKRLSGT
jgi:hypothetical protein